MANTNPVTDTAEAAERVLDLPHDVEPSDEQIRKAAEPLKRAAMSSAFPKCCTR